LVEAPCPQKLGLTGAGAKPYPVAVRPAIPLERECAGCITGDSWGPSALVCSCSSSWPRIGSAIPTSEVPLFQRRSPANRHVATRSVPCKALAQSLSPRSGITPAVLALVLSGLRRYVSHPSVSTFRLIPRASPWPTSSCLFSGKHFRVCAVVRRASDLVPLMNCGRSRSVLSVGLRTYCGLRPLSLRNQRTTLPLEWMSRVIDEPFSIDSCRRDRPNALVPLLITDGLLPAIFLSSVFSPRPTVVLHRIPPRLPDVPVSL